MIVCVCTCRCAQCCRGWRFPSFFPLCVHRFFACTQRKKIRSIDYLQVLMNTIFNSLQNIRRRFCAHDIFVRANTSMTRASMCTHTSAYPFLPFPFLSFVRRFSSGSSKFQSVCSFLESPICLVVSSSYRCQQVPAQPMTNMPQPATLHNTGNKS